MKKFILFLAVLFAFSGISLAQAKNDDIKSNVANIPKTDLRQRIQVEESASGNMAWLTGAKIVEISRIGTTTSNLIKVKIFGQDYKVQVATDTAIVRSYWGKSATDLSEFSIGDIINVYGTLDSADYFLIRAKTIRNISIQKIQAVFNGNILSISSSTASSTGSFIMSIKKTGTSTLTVYIDSNTKIYSRKNLQAFSDLKIGAKIMVRGIWDRAMSKIQALLVRTNPSEVEGD